MIDEDTGEEPTCPYCGSAEDCPHLLAVLDKNFPECRGGYCYERLSEFSSRIQSAFIGCLDGRSRRPGTAWKNELLQELWDQWPVDLGHSGAEDVAVDSYVLMRLVVDLLECAGGDCHPGSLVDDSGPGFTSSMEIIYAEQPNKVFDAAVQELERRLSDVTEVRHPLR